MHSGGVPVLLLFQNLGRIMDGWGSEGRAMVYLAPGFTVDMQSEVESALLEMEGISRVFLYPKIRPWTG